MKLARTSIIVGVGLAIAAGFCYLQSGVPTASRPTAGENIIVFGDSLVEGVGATAGNDFVSVLSRRVGVRIINAGRRGDTTGSALSRLDEHVLARNPRIVIVLIGGNDFLRRVPRQETFANLERIVSRIRQQGAAVVLIGVSLGLFADHYGRDYDGLARRTSAVFVPDILDGILGHPERMADAIHPNDVGYEIIADRLEPALRDLIRAE